MTTLNVEDYEAQAGEEEVQTEPIFTAHDRCDRCQSQAYVGVSKGEAELLFCLHHSKKYIDALYDNGWKVNFDTVAIAQLVSPQ